MKLKKKTITDIRVEEFINDPNTTVEIYYNNDTGEWLYSVCVCGSEFWLDSFYVYDDAINFILKYNLKFKERI